MTSPQWRRQKATTGALKKFDERYAKKMGHPPVSGPHQKYEVCPTGSLALDAALKVGGWPRGRLVQIVGNPHVGKTTLALLSIAAAQRAFPDQLCSWVDPENSWDERWAVANGVDLARLRLEQNPGSAQDTIDAHEEFLASGMFSLSVLDSVGALITQREIAKLAGEEAVAEVARLMSRHSRKSSAMVAATETTALYLNQFMSTTDQYSGDIPCGGKKLQFMLSVSVTVRLTSSKPKTIKIEGHPDPIPVSRELAGRVTKNKTAAYGDVAYCWLTNRASDAHGPLGIDRAEEASRFGVQVGVVEKGSGSYYILPDGTKVNGMPKLREEIRRRPDVIEEIRAKLIASLADQVEEQPDSDEETEALLDEVL